MVLDNAVLVPTLMMETIVPRLNKPKKMLKMRWMRLKMLLTRLLKQEI
jgi:hypothetical protein